MRIWRCAGDTRRHFGERQVRLLSVITAKSCYNKPPKNLCPPLLKDATPPSLPVGCVPRQQRFRRVAHLGDGPPA